MSLSKDIEVVSKIAASFLKKQPASVVPILGKGSVNKVFIVETANTKIVVRMNNDRDVPAAMDEYTKEAWCIEKAAAKGVPVSKVLKVGVFEDRAFMMQSYITGDEGRNSPISRKYIWRQLGKYARLIHSVKVAGFGLKMSDLTAGDSRKSWLKYLDYNIDSLNEQDELLKLDVITESQSKIIRAIFENLKEKKFDFGLNHGDISLRNVIIDEAGTVNLIDWGSAEASIVPHHDLIEMLKMNMLENSPDEQEVRAFLDGYGITQVEFERMMPELESLLMLRAFDKLRWALDWKIKPPDEYISHTKDAVKKYVP